MTPERQFHKEKWSRDPIVDHGLLDVVQAAVAAEREGAAGVGGCLIQLKPSIASSSYEDEEPFQKDIDQV
jgi:hypothetical protein